MTARFVVHEHHATHLHWDLRLEMKGTLKSWALPKEPPSEPGMRRLAIAVEDHPLSYIDFEGQIPAGERGAGTVKIWDEGTYEVEEADEKKLVIQFHGNRLRGRYALIHTNSSDWLFLKVKKPVSENAR